MSDNRKVRLLSFYNKGYIFNVHLLKCKIELKHFPGDTVISELRPFPGDALIRVYSDCDLELFTHLSVEDAGTDHPINNSNPLILLCDNLSYGK